MDFPAVEVVSGLFLLFGGMILGYHLSKREDNDEEKNRLGLAKENSELKEALQRGHDTLTELEAKYSRQNGQLNVLQQLCDDWSASREEAERDRTKLEVLLTEHQSRNEELTAQLGEQTQRRIELEDHIHQVQHQHAEELGTVEAEWLKKYSHVETLLTQHQNDLKHASEENTRTAKQLHSSEARIAELTSELASQKTLYETITQNASGLEKEYTTLETSVKHANMRLKDAEARCAKAVSAKNLAEESMAALRDQLDEQRNENSELKSTLAGLKSLEQQYSAVQSSLASSDERLQVVASERDRAIGAEKAAHEHMVGLQKRLENQESTIKQLRVNQDDAFDKIRCEIEKRTESEKEFDRVQMQLQQELNSQTTRVESVEQERDEAITKLSERCDELAAKLEAESNQRCHFEASWQQSHNELESLRAEHEPLKEQFATESQQHEKIRAEYAGICATLESESTHKLELEKQKTRLESALKTLKARCDQMMVEISELQQIRDQHALASDKWKQYRVRLEQTLSQRDSSMAMLNAKKSEIEQLEFQLSSANETVRQLRDQLFAQQSGDRILPLSEARTTVDHEYGGNTRFHKSRGVVFTEKPKIVDDLKMISGVAEVMEGKLNDYGVYTFRQVMEWNPKNIEEFQQLLPSFKDRIIREDWIGQAAHLYEHFHGDDAQNRAA